MVYIYTMQDYSAAKKKKKEREIMPFAATWMDLEVIILTEGLRARQISYDITYVESRKLYKWTYLQNRNRLTDRENKLNSYQKGKEEGEIKKEFGITDTNYYI